MRTKTLLAAAAIIAAGVLSSEAQSNVYSLNVVGYINITLKAGKYNLVTAQLKNPSSPTSQIISNLTSITGLADGSTLFNWNQVSQDFNQPNNWVNAPPDGPTWYDSGYTAPSLDTVPLGTAFFIDNQGGTDATMTLVGEVPQGVTGVGIIGGAKPNNLMGDPVPISANIVSNSFPVVDGSTLQFFDTSAGAKGDYGQPYNGVGTPPDGPAFYDGGFTTVLEVKPAVGQGFLYSNPVGTNNWNRTFTVQ